MKKIVVTGATSMLGMALLQECFKEDTEVYAIVRPHSPHRERLKAYPLHVIEEELDNEESLQEKLPKDCEIFYHFAWLGTGPDRNKDIEKQYKNIDLSIKCLRLAANIGCKKFISSGSQAEYGNTGAGRIREDSPLNPTTAYGIAKLSAGKFLHLLGRQLGIETVWVRVFSVYGIYEKETTMIQSALTRLLKGEIPAFTPAEQMWDYLYSKDAGRAFYLLGLYGKGQKDYCLGSGLCRPLRDYIYELRDAIDPKLALGIGKLSYPEGALMHLCADIEELTADTGFIPAYSFEEGIKETIRWKRGEFDEENFGGDTDL